MNGLPGKQILDRITRNSNTFYLISHDHIGDLIVVGGLAHAIKRSRNVKNLTILTKDSLRKVRVKFSGVDDMMYIPDDVMAEIVKYIQMSRINETENYIYDTFKTDEQGRIIWDVNLDIIQRFIQNAFSLPSDTKYIKPTLESLSDERSIAKLHNKYLLDNESTVVLTPYANSSKLMNENFWITLVNNLKQMNYKVYTNVGTDEEEPILGTLPMATTFPELAYISDKVKCFIGLRSGILDFLACTNAKILCISSLFHWHYKLKTIFPESNSKTFFYVGWFMAPISKYLNDFIISQWNLVSINLQLSLNHKFIDRNDIYLSDDDLIEAVLYSIDQMEQRRETMESVKNTTPPPILRKPCRKANLGFNYRRQKGVLYNLSVSHWRYIDKWLFSTCA